MHTRMRPRPTHRQPPTTYTHKVLHAYLAVVLIGVEHDGRIGKNVDHIGVLEQFWALHVVSRPKALHDTIDLLGLAGQSERVQVHSDGDVKRHACQTDSYLVTDKYRTSHNNNTIQQNIT